MRDIKSNQPNKRKKGLIPRDDFDSADMELYDVNEEIKAKSRKEVKIDRAIRKLEPRPRKRVEEKTMKRRDTSYKKKISQKTKAAGGKKWTGSKVPLTKIHAESEIPVSHGDKDHKKLNGELEIKAKKYKRVKKNFKAPGRVRVGKGERWALLFIFGLVALAAVAAVVIFLPTANVEVELRTAPLLVDEEIVIAADGTSEVVPGTAFWREVEVTEDYAVQNKEMVGSKAGGTVTLINNTVDEQPIRERSRLVTADGQLFYMLKHAILPAKSSAEVKVEAAEAGEEGNISAQRLNFVGLDEASQKLVYAEASQELSGGSGEEISVVAESDIKAAKDEAAKAARGEAETAIKNELPDGWSLLDESWTAEIGDLTTEAEAGQKTASFGYTAKVTIRVMGYEQEVLQEKLRAELESQLDEKFMLFPGQISYSKSVKDIDWEKGRAILSTRVTHTTIARLSLDSLRSKVAGRSIKETQEYLEGLPGVRMVKIETWPFWVNSIPRIEKRVTLELKPERQP